MTRWIAFMGIVVLGVAAMVTSERRNVDVPVSADALLYLVADTEQELTRMPVQFTRLSDAEEIAIGNEIARGNEREGEKDPETKAIEAYLTQVGARVAANAHRKLPYKFHYIPDDNFVNAFALPGGHVYVGAGLIGLMDSEDELAAVVGHEIEHIDHYHCAERVQLEQALHKIPLGGLIGIPIEVFQEGYSKDQELEADAEGTRLSVAAGYSANGAIRMFETFQRLFDEYHARARNPEEELSQVAQETLDGYFRSHPLPAERIARVQQMMAAANWQPHAERDLGVAFIFMSNRAMAELHAHKYPQAQQLATRSLQMQPGQQKALEVLARAQFAQADFAAAAASYRKLLDLDPTRLAAGYAALYAQALGAANRQTAAAEFRGFANSIKGEQPRELRVHMAGLSLLAGDASPARSLTAEANSNSTADWVPGAFGDLGWYYYLSANYPEAQNSLDIAVEERPGNIDFATSAAWARIENLKYADALQTLDRVSDSGSDRADRRMARATALWLSKQPDDALRLFESAINDQPEWNNPRWVQALYSPLVAKSVEDMKTERERRHKELLAKAHK
jgi:beta-barrel assembly-enhancing protease